MKKCNLFLLIMVLFVFVLLTTGQRVEADSMPIGIKAILPENQFNKEVSYYHLMMEPGQKQVLDFQLVNTSDKEVTAEVTLAATTTNDNGNLDYNLPDKKMDKSLLYPLTEIAETPKEVKIPANSEIITKINVTMPTEEFSGIILGGINVKVKAEEKKKDKEAGGGMKIENVLNYSIAVLLVENEERVKTDMTLQKIFASQVTGINTTKVTLQNPTMAVIENITIEAKIYGKESDKILYETKKEGYRMAPNSSFDFGVALGNERYRAGDYRLKLVATSDPQNTEDGERQVWEFDEAFTIKREEADKLNESAVDLPADYSWYYLIAGVIVVLLISSIVALILWKRKKRAKKVVKRRTNKNNKRKSSK